MGLHKNTFRRSHQTYMEADLPTASIDESVVRNATSPFSETGGLRVMQGNLGRAVVKVSAVPAERCIVEAPAIIFETQEALLDAFKAGSLERDFVAVVRFQGPRANGMPELHKLTPPLSVLQGKGFKVAIVTDGRMSGASGEILAAIHVSPEVLAGGPLGRVRDGDMIRVDAVTGNLQALVPAEEWAARAQAELSRAGHHQFPGPGPRLVRRPPPQRSNSRGRSGDMAVTTGVVTSSLTSSRELALRGPIIPVIVIQRLEDAVPLAKALVAGGITVLEITLRTKIALPAMEAISAAVPEAIVGAGTVRSASDAHAAKRAGCKFAVSPGYLAEVGDACAALDLPLLPGVSTASEVMAANAGGYDFLKLFPATAVGGIGLLKALAGPFPDVAFCPTGGITLEDSAAVPGSPQCAGMWR